jgi:diacylglycerol kinase family enzyme
VIGYVKGETLRYTFDGEQSICVDGEVVEARELEISAAKDALCLIVPKGAAYLPKAEPMPAGVY